MTGKPKVKSKTLWFNAITLIVALVGVALDFVPLFELSDAAKLWLSLSLTMANVGGNTILRLITSEPLR